jgi:hypothetical protein
MRKRERGGRREDRVRESKKRDRRIAGSIPRFNFNENKSEFFNCPIQLTFFSVLFDFLIFFGSSN